VLVTIGAVHLAGGSQVLAEAPQNERLTRSPWMRTAIRSYPE
jgi:hypothetical protein